MYDEVKNHPISKLNEIGFNISLNTDNRLMSNTSVLNELAMAKLSGIKNPEQLLKYSASDSFLN
jgi:adenosine deaminase